MTLICGLGRHQDMVRTLGYPRENLSQLLGARPNLRSRIAHSLLIELQEILGPAPLGLGVSRVR